MAKLKDRALKKGSKSGGKLRQKASKSSSNGNLVVADGSEEKKQPEPNIISGTQFNQPPPPAPPVPYFRFLATVPGLRQKP